MCMMNDPRPSFKDACQRHAVTVRDLVKDLNEHRILGVTPAVVTLVYEQGRGKAQVIGVLLQALSRLAGTTYTRKNVGGFYFLTDAESEVEEKRVHPGR